MYLQCLDYERVLRPLPSFLDECERAIFDDEDRFDPDTSKWEDE